MNNTSPSSARRDIALTLILVSGFVIVLTSSIMILFAGNVSSKEGAEAAKVVFTSLLPVIGTWVGAVIAYYFSSDNFDRATESISKIASQTIDDKLRGIKVTDVMIPFDKIITITIDGEFKRPDNVTIIQDCLGTLGEKYTRLPLFNQLGKILYLLHESVLNKYIASQLRKIPQPGMAIQDHPGEQLAVDLNSLTLADYLQDPERKQTAVSTIAFVNQDACLADAKQAMKAIEKCQDVFITKNGKANEPVIGWVTNVIISEHSRA